MTYNLERREYCSSSELTDLEGFSNLFQAHYRMRVVLSTHGFLCQPTPSAEMDYDRPKKVFVILFDRVFVGSICPSIMIVLSSCWMILESRKTKPISVEAVANNKKPYVDLLTVEAHAHPIRCCIRHHCRSLPTGLPILPGWWRYWPPSPTPLDEPPPPPSLL